MERRYPDITSDYCRSCAKRCDDCPAPKLLPECATSVVAFATLKTQWRVGMSGRTGLDYTACFATLDRYLPRWQASDAAFAALTVEDLMGDVQIIERALLDADAEARERDNATRQQQGNAIPAPPVIGRSSLTG